MITRLPVRCQTLLCVKRKDGVYAAVVPIPVTRAGLPGHLNKYVSLFAMLNVLNTLILADSLTPHNSFRRSLCFISSSLRDVDKIFLPV